MLTLRKVTIRAMVMRKVTLKMMEQPVLLTRLKLLGGMRNFGDWNIRLSGRDMKMKSIGNLTKILKLTQTNMVSKKSITLQ